MPWEIILLSVLRGAVEVAGFALLGQGALALLAGRHRHDNHFYKILETVTRPAIRAVRCMTPRAIADAHLPALTLFLLFWLWIGLAAAKRYLCALQGLAC